MPPSESVRKLRCDIVQGNVQAISSVLDHMGVDWDGLAVVISGEGYTSTGYLANVDGLPQEKQAVASVGVAVLMGALDVTVHTAGMSKLQAAKIWLSGDSRGNVTGIGDRIRRHTSRPRGGRRPR